MKNKYWWFETKWHQKMVKALRIAGMCERTQETYVRSMRKLTEFYDKTPDKISEEELVDYFIHRQEVTEWSPATMRICYSGIKFFFINVLKRKWHTLKLAKAKREKRLPAILSREEVKKILSHDQYLRQKNII
ncbi:MAG: hypothetical protein BBJ57_05330 [Desulfobacterales bacterium PC51MH44]|nr:MAG: hypothetical protein BBJ57_05330 [Desulfobacterales bacterium PC51MH44]